MFFKYDGPNINVPNPTRERDKATLGSEIGLDLGEKDLGHRWREIGSA